MIPCMRLLVVLGLCTSTRASVPSVEGRHCNGELRHVHISVGADPSTMMTISFASLNSLNEAPIGGVFVGKHPDQLDRLVIEDEPALWYNTTLPRDKSIQYYSPYQHHITVDNLEPNTKYYYKCVKRSKMTGFPEFEKTVVQSTYRKSLEDDPPFAVAESVEEAEDASRRLAPPPYDPSKHGTCPDSRMIRSFQTAPMPGEGEHIKFAIVGDVGQFEHSIETIRHLRRHRDGISAVILAGDIAYTETDQRRWDTFFDFMDDFPLIDEIPLQIATGNHDVDKVAHRRDLFTAYETRFRMPRVAPPVLGQFDGPDGEIPMHDVPYPLPYEFGNAYYSFQYGPSYHIVISSYSSMDPGSTQYEWLLNEFASVDRVVTPWLFVTFHCPIYNTFRDHQKDIQVLMGRKHIEPLLVDNRVNMVFSGHVHAYMRTTTVAYEKVNATGPVHIIVGAGGRAALSPFLDEEPEDWVAVRDATLYGYGTVEIFNRTHARWDWIHTGNSGDFNVVYKSDVTIPSGGVDHTFVVNQYYL